MQRKRQSGFTLIEMAIVMALLAMVLGPVAAILSQFIRLPLQPTDTIGLLRSARQAARFIADDARQAAVFTPGSNPDYGTFTWVDYTTDPNTTYTVRYYYSTADTSLVREENNGSSLQTAVISDNIAAYGDISLQQSGSLLLVSATATIDSLNSVITRTATIQAKMRPVLPVAAPTPPPYRLAWDDFESGGWTWGGGWLANWYHTGDSSIVSTGAPYEGTYHMQLRAATGYVNRSLNLSGVTNARLQFRAKAASFVSGNTATASVSSDGSNWTTVQTWTQADADGLYRFYDIDLSSYSMTSQFWIEFAAHMTNTSNYFYVDDINIVSTW